MLTQDLIDDLSDHTWLAVTSADQVAFVTPIFTSSEESWTYGVVVWRIDADGYEQLYCAEEFLNSAPSYIEALDVLDMDAEFSEITDVGSILRIIAGDDFAPLIRTESISLDMRRMVDEIRCEVQTLERHTTTRLYGSSVPMRVIRHLWEHRAENLVLTEKAVRARLDPQP